MWQIISEDRLPIHTKVTLLMRRTVAVPSAVF
jgi:hypothetical protein